MRKLPVPIVIAALVLPVLALPPASAQETEPPEKYLLLATSRTGTMEEELNEAGARGYRFLATQGGETAFGGSEAVVVMTLDPEGRRFRYLLLATSRTGTMQRELNEAPAGVQVRRHDGVLDALRRQGSRRHPRDRDHRQLKTATPAAGRAQAFRRSTLSGARREETFGREAKRGPVAVRRHRARRACEYQKKRPGTARRDEGQANPNQPGDDGSIRRRLGPLTGLSPPSRREKCSLSDPRRSAPGRTTLEPEQSAARA